MDSEMFYGNQNPQPIYQAPIDWNAKWLVVGKGKSLQRHKDADVLGYKIITLNDACNVVRPNIAHAIDIDAIEKFSAKVIQDTRVKLLTVAYPHEGEKPGRHLSWYIPRCAALYIKHEQGNLYYYYHDRGANPSTYPTIRCTYFSGDTLIRLLAVLGVKHIRTLGFDGGDGRETLAHYFRKVMYKRKKENKIVNYSLQREVIDEIVKEYQIDYGRIPLCRI